MSLRTGFPRNFAIVLLSLWLTGGSAGQQSGQPGPVTGVITRPAPEAQRQPTTAAPAPKQATVPATEAAPTTVAFDRVSDPLVAGKQTFRLVSHLQRLEATSTQPADETTDWWELRGSDGRVIYRESYGVAFQDGGFESTVEVSARAINTKLGSGVLVEGMDLPSAPNSGSWVQVFGFQWGPKPTDLKPFGPPISTDGDLIDITTDPSRPTPVIPGRTVFVMNDIMRFRVWTGNFKIIYPVLINWITGKLEPSWRCVRSTSRGQIGRCSYPIEVDPRRENDLTFVRLFPEPDEGFTPKHVVVQPTSTIEYLEAEAPVVWSQDAKHIHVSVSDSAGVDPGGVWLKVRIDGREGWIHTEEDFQAVGLPQAG